MGQYVKHYIDGMTGYQLGERLFQITSIRGGWKIGDVHGFIMNNSLIFEIEMTEVIHQVGNGMVKFWINPGRWVVANYSYLQRFLDPGFVNFYNQIENNVLRWSDANPNNRWFQIFVLFRFEMERSKLGDEPRFPISRMTNEAVRMALRFGDNAAYETVINMFLQPRDIRRTLLECHGHLRQRYIMLLRIKWNC